MLEMRNFLSHFHTWKKTYFMPELKKLLCDAYLKYLIKILITQDFLKQSDQYRGVIRTRENSSNYNLAICHFAPVKAKNLYTVDFTKNISDYPFDQFESYVQPACYTLGEEYVLQASSFT